MDMHHHASPSLVHGNLNLNSTELHSYHGCQSLHLRATSSTGTPYCPDSWHHVQSVFARRVPPWHRIPSQAVPYLPYLPYCIPLLIQYPPPGSNVALSLIAIPAVLQAPAPLAAKQWHTVLTRGGALGRPLAILSGIATAYAAYIRTPPVPLAPHVTPLINTPPPPPDPRGSLPFKLNLAATVLVPAIVPFTLAFISPTNNKLIAKKDEFASLSQRSTQAKAGMPGGWDDVDVEGGETVHALIDRWALLNLARAALVAGGAFCTLLAALR